MDLPSRPSTVRCVTHLRPSPTSTAQTTSSRGPPPANPPSNYGKTWYDTDSSASTFLSPTAAGPPGWRSKRLCARKPQHTGAILTGLQHVGGLDGNGMWGAPQLGRWKWHDPYMHAALLAQNDTRIWIFSPQTFTAGDAASMLGVADQAQAINQMFYAQYRSIGGHNGHFDLPVSGDHGWSIWGSELGAMSGDIAGAIR
jgi:S-formylglutathione hydrolase FrmB